MYCDLSTYPTLPAESGTSLGFQLVSAVYYYIMQYTLQNHSNLFTLLYTVSKASSQHHSRHTVSSKDSHTHIYIHIIHTITVSTV